jgi:hypothetical protein
MATVVAVPIRLDALPLSTPLSVVEAKADFTRLPYWNGDCEVNPDVANISEYLLSFPFSDRALVLPKGVHLHWALPDALTRGSSRNTTTPGHQMIFPAVPNCWLVTRSINDQVDAQWIVESDYLFPEKETPVSDGVSLLPRAIPFPADRTKGERPFRYLGYARKFSDPAKPESSEYLWKSGYRLTAVGYQPEPLKVADVTKPGQPPPAEPVIPKGGLGEPTFAALYANCSSVFGFHDATAPASTKGLKYDVIGWFAKSEHDCLASITASSVDEFKDALEEAYGWKLMDKPAKLPKRTIFHASINMDQAVKSSPGVGPVTVAMGNTVTEALSAYLASQAKAKVPVLGFENLPTNLEEQLEALHLADRIDHLAIDVGQKFQHARHERGFSAVSGGTVWSVRVPSKPSEPGKPETPVAPLPEDVAGLLNQLNIAQRKYDRTLDELDLLQKQLFADWYKYMLCSYPPPDAPDDFPDIDEVRYFVERNDLQVIENKKQVRDTAKTDRDNCQKLVEDKVKSPYELQSRPGVRYYRPNEPVLLIADAGLRQTQRHGLSGPLECAVPDLEIDSTSAAIKALRDNKAVWTKLSGGGANPDAPGTWHPFSLDWRVEMQPLKQGNNLNTPNRIYDSKFITGKYQFKPAGVDLSLTSGADIEPAASVYTGSSLMTSHARLQLKERINEFLSKRLLKKYFDAKGTPLAERTNDFFETHFDEIRSWYIGKKPDKTIGDPVVDTMLQVANIIDGQNFNVLAQSLNGFNEALLMHKQTLQLPMAEPLGFDDAQDFTRRVAGAVGPNTYVAPQPLDDFQPIRTGGFKVLALRLVDTFGRVEDLKVKEWVATELMPASPSNGLFSLPPRLVQPARLSFKWLSGAAVGNEIEMNSHPATTPICGWLLPNHLDQSLMVYNAAGKAQGSLTQDATWISAPGAEAIGIEKLPKHLGNLVAHLKGLQKAGLNTFFSLVDTALKHINPVSAPQHDALALLMGRPIAVVRAQLRLELRGQAAFNQSWDAFRTDLAHCFENEAAGKTDPLVRKSDGVTAVKFPVLLGDSLQLNDGLLGFWIESKNPNPYTTYQSGNGSLIELAVDDLDVTLTMLIDPRGVVHLTSGILPAKALDIPTDQYAAAMQAIEVTFLTAPILSPASKIGLPLPSEPDRAWSWLARGKNGWLSPAEIGPASTQAAWGDALEIHEGWLRLTNTEKPK